MEDHCLIQLLRELPRLTHQILVAYLRSKGSPYQILDSAKSFIDTVTLTGAFNFVNTFPGILYLTIKQRNSLQTWSAAGGSIFLNGNNNYDFTNSASKAYGNNMILKGNKYCIYSGDVNYDNFVEINDMTKIDNDAFNFLTGDLITDLNGDYSVDLADLTLADNNAINYVEMKRP